MQNDPEQALRLPPHVTLCYQPPTVDPDRLERQVRHAFPSPVLTQLGTVKQLQNPDGTYYVEVLQTQKLEEAHLRLCDKRYEAVPNDRPRTWHVTCVRYGRTRQRDALIQAARNLALKVPWVVDTISYLELRAERYECVANWRIE
jgi:hypothetical protein